jgi:D-alanyl-D-alanine carboxypeptidase
MTSRANVVWVTAAVFLSTASAHAGPCTADIVQFENTIRNSATMPLAGPSAPQTTAAQLGHQPTPATVRQAEEQAQAEFEGTLARAKTFDAQGRGAECAQALRDAKLMLDLP